MFVHEDDAASLDSDERIRSPLPEVTPREIPLHIEAVEEVDEGVPPDNGDSARNNEGLASLRDYSYSYSASGADTGPEPRAARVHAASPRQPFAAGEVCVEDAL